MERENDRNIDYMGDRISALKKITVDIHDEVEGQHRLLDETSDEMQRAKQALRESAAAFQNMIENARRHKYFWQISGFIVASFFILRLMFSG
jgi:blocked-early-in-transport protein 1